MDRAPRDAARVRYSQRMANELDQRTDGWITLEGVRLAPIDGLDQALKGFWFDVFTAILSLFASAIVQGLRASRRTPQIDPIHAVIRSGTRSIALADIDRARIMVLDDQLQNGIVDLQFGASGKLQLAVLLRDAHGVVAPESTRRLLAEAFAATSIDIPRDKYDPTGRFARSGAPFNVTRDEAIALVLDPPPADGDLPIIR